MRVGSISICSNTARALGAIFVLFQSACDAAHPGKHASANLRQDLAASDDVGYSETASGLEDSESFAQDFIFIGRKVDDAVGNNYVDRVIGQRNVLDFAL